MPSFGVFCLLDAVRCRKDNFKKFSHHAMRFLFLLQVPRRLQVQRGHGRRFLSLITVKRKLVIEVSLLYCSLQAHSLFFFLLLCSVAQLNETNVQYHKIVFVHNKNILCYILLHCDSVIVLPSSFQRFHEE